MAIVVLDLPSYLLFLSLTVGFFALLFIIMYIFAKMPPAARTIVTCWLKKRLLVIDADVSGLLFFKALKKGESKGQFERQLKGGHTEIKIVPRHSNPIISTPYHLEKTGIPTFFSCTAKTILANPLMLLAMRISELTEDEREVLPADIKKLAKATKLPIQKVVKVRGKDEFKRITIEVPLFQVTPLQLMEFFRTTYDQGQIRIRLKQEWFKGLRRGKALVGPMAKIAIPIGLVLLGIILLIFFMSGGGGFL